MGWFLAGSIAIFTMVLFGHNEGYLIVFPKTESQVELVTLFLAAATLIITTVALLLAVGAVVGYSALKEAAEAAGKLAGETAAREALTPMVQREVAARMGATGPDRTDELTAALAGRDNDAQPPDH
jgi:hypothetical protein